MIRKARFTAVLLLLCILLAACGGRTELASVILDEPIAEAPPADYDMPAEGFRYARQFLLPQEKAVYDTLLAGLKAHEPEITGLYPDSDMISAAADAISRDYPELFWYSGAGSISTTLLGDEPIRADYVPDYVYSEADTARLQAAIDAKAQDCLNGIPAGSSDYDVLLHIYEYIVWHTAYGMEDSNSIVNVLVEGHGLCGCYAKTFQYLCGLAGIPCAYFSGTADGSSHAWNAVWPDGVPCWVDVTWGDPVIDGRSDGDDISYLPFCLPSSDFLRNHTADDAVPLPDCVSTDYDYFRRSGSYLTWYDVGAIRTALEWAIMNGQSALHLRFSEDCWQQATEELLDNGAVFELLRQAEDDLGITLALDHSVSFSRVEDMCGLTIKIPY